MLDGLGEGTLYPGNPAADGGLVKRLVVDGVGLDDTTPSPKDWEEAAVDGGLIEFDGWRSDELDPAILIGAPWTTFWEYGCCCCCLGVLDADGISIGEGAIDRGLLGIRDV